MRWRGYEPTAGAFSATPDWSLVITNTTSPCTGVEQLALHPDGTRLYVPVPGGLDVHSTVDGALLETITLSPQSDPRAVCVQQLARSCAS